MVWTNPKDIEQLPTIIGGHQVNWISFFPAWDITELAQQIVWAS